MCVFKDFRPLGNSRKSQSKSDFYNSFAAFLMKIITLFLNRVQPSSAAVAEWEGVAGQEEEVAWDIWAHCSSVRKRESRNLQRATQTWTGLWDQKRAAVSLFWLSQGVLNLHDSFGGRGSSVYNKSCMNWCRDERYIVCTFSYRLVYALLAWKKILKVRIIKILGRHQNPLLVFYLSWAWVLQMCAPLPYLSFVVLSVYSVVWRFLFFRMQSWWRLTVSLYQTCLMPHPVSTSRTSHYQGLSLPPYWRRAPLLGKTHSMSSKSFSS